VLSFRAGFTTAEVREFVFEYHSLGYGLRSPWLAERGISKDRMYRWRSAVFDGDLDRGLIPREGSPVTVPSDRRSALAETRTAERAAHSAEVERLQARVRELERANDALGKAIGLLHERNAHEPADTPTSNDRSDSSTPRTGSSPS
jgi:transposase-like protein